MGRGWSAQCVDLRSRSLLMFLRWRSRCVFKSNRYDGETPMDLEGFFLLAGVVAIVCTPIVMISWGMQKRRIGTIRCRRCHHVGSPKGLWMPYRGMKAVCQRCHGEDWEVVTNTSVPTEDETNGPSEPTTYYMENGEFVWTCGCGHRRRAATKLAGRVAPCPRCKARTVIPTTRL